MRAKHAAAKAAVRKQLRAERRAIHPALHRLRSRQAARAIARLPQFRCGRRVAVYLPFDREADTSHLIAAAQRRGVRLFVPVVIDRRHRRLAFHPLSERTRRGVFGIRVPVGGGRPVAARWLNLIVGFGLDCQRVDDVGAESWDLRFDATATESGLQHYARDT